jgi:hypothetical protein
MDQDEDEVLMGMGIEEVHIHDGVFRVLTPGSCVTLDDKGLLSVEQRIGVKRRLLSCQLPAHLSAWRVSKHTPFRCILEGNGLKLTVQGDSVLIFTPQQHLRLMFTGHFKPRYAQEARGNRLLLDPSGGCGFFGIPARPTWAEGLESDGWSLLAHLARWDELWVSICPPRRRDEEKYYESLAHEGSADEPYPSDEIIRSDAQYCKVFTLHEAWAADAPEWAENPPGAAYQHPKPWETDHPVPADPDEFNRVRDEVHRLSMKLVVYFSPYYSNAPDLFAEMQRILDDYGVDGLYFDGWCGHRDDFRPAYYMIRRARAILGKRLLYLHSSTEPFGTCRVYLPFVYAYADYVLSGEAGRDGLDREEFLRYTVSGYQIGNFVGLWCYYGSMGLPGYHNVVPSDDDIRAALRNYVRIWRTAQAWSKMPEELARFDKQYYGLLEEHRNSF